MSNKMSNNWQDQQYDRGEDLLSFPFIQWVNDGNSLDPRHKRGGFAISAEQNVDLLGSTQAVIHHKNGDTTECHFVQRLEMAVLKSVLSWELDGLRIPRYIAGARGRQKAIGSVRGVDGKRFHEARQAFARNVRVATKGKAKSYAFYMPLVVGDIESVGPAGSKSNITPIVLSDEQFDPNAAFIGGELLQDVPWETVDEWANYKPKPDDLDDVPDDLDAVPGGFDVSADELANESIPF